MWRQFFSSFLFSCRNQYIKPRDHVIVCAWSRSQQCWSHSDTSLSTRTWFAVVTSCSPLLWLVIDTTSKAYTHARRSHNSDLPQEKQQQHNSPCSLVRREWRRDITDSLCFFCRQECATQLISLKQHYASIRVWWRIWCKQWFLSFFLPRHPK